MVQVNTPDNKFVQTCKNSYNYADNKANCAGRKLCQFAEKNPKTVNVAKIIAIYALTILSAIISPISTIIGFTVGLIIPKKIQVAVDAVKNCFLKQNLFVKGLMIATAAITSFIPVVSGIVIGSLAGSETRKMFG